VPPDRPGGEGEVRRRRRTGQQLHQQPQAWLAAAEVAELSEPTLNPGKDYQTPMADSSAFAGFDPAPYEDGRGFGYVGRPLALEHLHGAR
jgi:hypothetical protein